MDQSQYYRVTSIIKPFSGIEFVPAKYLEPAALRGQQVHYHIQNKLSGFETPCNSDVLKPYLDSFDIFWKDSLHIAVGARIIQEKRLFCDENKISGQFDCLIQTEEKTYIFDWKTSSKLQPATWRLQGAAYKYLCEINGFTNVTNCVFVKLDKYGGKPTLFQCDNYDEDLERFFNCFDLYKYFEMHKRRNNGD